MNKTIEQYAAWLDVEFGQWGDTSEEQRVAKALTTIEQLRLQMRTSSPAEIQRLCEKITALEASIADFGF